MVSFPISRWQAMSDEWDREADIRGSRENPFLRVMMISCEAGRLY